jgi:Uma2 family endonuclease
MTLLTSPLSSNHFVARVDWDGYGKILEAMAPNRIRITYDQGWLELMSPTPEHERLKSQLSRVLEALFLAFDVDFLNGGSTTFKSQLIDRGFEPDECYWLTNLDKVADVSAYDPTVGPFPDLGIEIDVTSSSINRKAIYAAFQVAELWRYEQDGQLRCYRLQDGDYAAIERSRFLPQMPISELQRFVEEGRLLITSKLIRRARHWAEEQASEGLKTEDV